MLHSQEKDGGAHADLFMPSTGVARYESYGKISGRAYSGKIAAIAAVGLDIDKV